MVMDYWGDFKASRFIKNYESWNEIYYMGPMFDLMYAHMNGADVNSQVKLIFTQILPAYNWGFNQITDENSELSFVILFSVGVYSVILTDTVYIPINGEVIAATIYTTLTEKTWAKIPDNTHGIIYLEPYIKNIKIVSYYTLAKYFEFKKMSYYYPYMFFLYHSNLKPVFDLLFSRMYQKGCMEVTKSIITRYLCFAYPEQMRHLFLLEHYADFSPNGGIITNGLKSIIDSVNNYNTELPIDSSEQYVYLGEEIFSIWPHNEQDEKDFTDYGYLKYSVNLKEYNMSALALLNTYAIEQMFPQVSFGKMPIKYSWFHSHAQNNEYLYNYIIDESVVAIVGNDLIINPVCCYDVYVYASRKMVKADDVKFMFVFASDKLVLDKYNIVSTINFLKEIYSEILNYLEVEYDENLRVKTM